MAHIWESDHPLNREAANVVNDFLKMFGLDLSKYHKGDKWTWSMVQNAINQAYSRLETLSASAIAQAQQKLDQLMALPGSKLIQNVVSKARKSLQQGIIQQQKNEAANAVQKVHAQNLANELDNMSVGDWRSSKGKQTRRAIQENLRAAVSKGNALGAQKTDLSAVEKVVA